LRTRRPWKPRATAISSDVEDWNDRIAERVGALGGGADGTVQVAARDSHLAPYPLTLGSGKAHVEAVADAIATFAGAARMSIDETTVFGDASTSDVLSETVRGADQSLWKLESHRERVEIKYFKG
jgi:starvation-inducible DNA-binding protein